MAAWLHSRVWLLLGSIVIISITGVYITFAVRPLLERPAPGAAVAGLVRHDAQDLGGGPDGGDFPHVRLGGWSALAMLGLTLPFAVSLAFSATDRRRDLSLVERALWLAICVISLALFFLTANIANTFVDQLLG